VWQMALKEIKTEIEHYFVDESGKKQGEYKWWYSNGQTWMHCFYVDGKQHGEFKAWHENGQTWVHCFYVDGKRHGEYKTWYLNGQLRRHCFYVDDNKVIDFFKEPDEYPTSAEVKTYFALKYGSAKWLPNN
jgi:antitoxin component YwqK of YwqJK toxin-antitoxin module